MRQMIVSIVAVMVIAISASAGAGPSRNARSDEAQVANLQRSWQKAYTQGDDATVRRLVSDRFVLTTTTGTVLNKSNAVSHFGTEREKADLVFEDQQVLVYGTAAIATAKVRELSGDRQVLLRATDTFVKQRGGWRVAASHWTRLPPELVEAPLTEQARVRFVGEYRGPQGGLVTVARRGARFLVTSPKSAPVEFVAISETMLVDPASNVRWLFIGETSEAFRYVVVQNPEGLIKLHRA